MKAADRAVLALGVASLFSTVFALPEGDPWELVTMPGRAVVIAVVLGLLACAAAVSGRREPAIAVGGAFLLAAVLVPVELAVGEKWIGGTGSTFSLWLGFGVGLVAAGLVPHDLRVDDRGS